jgi:hypothetical protein
MKILTSAEIGTRLEAVARAVAPALVAVYTAGYMLGQWLHATNDRLAAAYLQLLGLERPPVQAAPAAPKPVIRAAVHTAPLTVEALCKAHTQRELMVMAGTRSKRSKKQLAKRILTTK